MELAQHFQLACLTGDLDAMLELLADDATLWTDGGGVVKAARRVIVGARKAARFLIAVTPNLPPTAQLHEAIINGQPGTLVVDDGAADHDAGSLHRHVAEDALEGAMQQAFGSAADAHLAGFPDAVVVIDDVDSAEGEAGGGEFGDGELDPLCDGEPEPVPPPTPPSGGPLTGGIGTIGVLSARVVTLGVLSCGVATGPTVTDGTVTDGTVADGTVTDGTVPAGTVAGGTLTVGTVTVGTDTVGIAAPAGGGDDTASTVEQAATAADRPQPIAPRLNNAPPYTIENPQNGVYTRRAAAERAVSG